MIDHVSLKVQDFERAVSFYKAALAPIGYEVVMEYSGVARLGAGGKADLWIMQSEPPINSTHIALASERTLVDAFHAAAVAAGGSDNGAPGLRPETHPHYYAAFIFDPEGNNVEVVCHAPPDAAKPAAAPKAAARKPAPKAKVKAKVKAKATATPAPKAKPVKAKAKAKPAKAKAKPVKAKAKPVKKRR